MNIWDKLAKAVVCLLFAAGLLMVGVWYLPLIRQNERMRKEMLRIESQIEKEEEKNKILKIAIDSSHSDPKTVERLARTHLGYGRPGEIIIRFEPPVSTNVNPPAINRSFRGRDGGKPE
jgi:cell division protein FtsB